LLISDFQMNSEISFVGTFAGEMNGHSDGTNFMPHFITVNAGEVCLNALSLSFILTFLSVIQIDDTITSKVIMNNIILLYSLVFVGYYK